MARLKVSSLKQNICRLIKEKDGWRISGPDSSMLLPFDQAHLIAECILGDVPEVDPVVAVEDLAEPGVPETLTEKVIRLIKADLACEAFTVGQRLDESGLAKRYGVSRTPVREALAQLAASGAVVRLPRRGCRVADAAKGRKPRSAG
jgi:hypothetical protein